MISTIDKIRAEVERRIDYLLELFFTSKELEQKEAMHDCDLLVREYRGLLSFLDTLPEQTASEGLEEEVRKYLSERWKLGCTPITPVCLPNFTTDDLKECAEFFYRLGLINKK